MIPVIAGLLVVAVLAYVLYPLLLRRFRAEAGSDVYARYTDPEYQALLDERDTAYEALMELEFDRSLGKLSETDYRKLYERYRRNAVALLKAQNERESSISAKIEEQVRSAREAALELMPAEPSEPNGRACPSCGKPVGEDAVYCSSCGMKLLLAASEPDATGSSSNAQPSSDVRVADGTSESSLLRERRRKAKLLGAGLLAISMLILVVISIVFVQRSNASMARSVGTIPGPSTYEAITLSPDSPTWALAAGSRGNVMQSVDSGRSWSKLSSLNGYATSLKAAPGSGRILYALVGGTLERSADTGQTWKRAGEDPGNSKITAFAVVPGSSSTLYATTVRGELYVTRDGGSRWTLAGKGVPADISSLTVARAKPLMLFAASTKSGVYQSDGKSWGKADGFVNGALPTNTVYDIAFDASTGEGGALPGGGRSNGTLYIATDQGVYRSVDYGGSWDLLGLTTDTRALAIGTSGSGVMMAINNDGNVFISGDRGATWNGG